MWLAVRSLGHNGIPVLVYSSGTQHVLYILCHVHGTNRRLGASQNVDRGTGRTLVNFDVDYMLLRGLPSTCLAWPAVLGFLVGVRVSSCATVPDNGGSLRFG